MDFSWFGLVWSGHGFINCLASALLLCPFHKELIICEKMTLVFCQTDIKNPRFRHELLLNGLICFKVHVENLLDEIWKLVNLVSFVSQQRGSP